MTQMSWRLPCGVELLNLINFESGKTLSYYLNQFKSKHRATASRRYQGLLDDELIEAYEEPSGEITLNITEKGKLVLFYYWKIDVIYGED